MRESFVWWIAAALWAGLIFWLSSIPASDDRLGWLDLPGLDKVAHAIGFGILAALTTRAAAGLAPTQAAALGIVTASLYGILDEYHQSFVAGRTADALDWVADTLGAIAGATAVAFLGRSA